MADTHALLIGLEEYSRTLYRHVSELRDHFNTLSREWSAFSDHYQGEAANQFRDHWLNTTRRFQEYIEGTEAINRLLEERIEHLRAADRRESVLG